MGRNCILVAVAALVQAHTSSSENQNAPKHTEHKAEMENELLKLENEGNLNFAQWVQNNRLQQAQNEASREEVLKDAQLNVEVSRLNAEKERFERAAASEEKEDKKRRAMEMFEQVQAKKQERMRLDAEQEKQRLDQHAKASENTISVLEKIASTATDPAVQMEALKQLAELRKGSWNEELQKYEVDTVTNRIFHFDKRYEVNTEYNGGRQPLTKSKDETQSEWEERIENHNFHMELLSKENARKNYELGERVKSQKENNNGTLSFEYGFTGY